MELSEILAHGTGLPADFMAARRAAMVITNERVRNGSTEPIPELASYPGVYRELPKLDFQALKAKRDLENHRATNARWREKHRKPKGEKGEKRERNPSKSVARGDLEIGAAVVMGGEPGTVLAYLPPFSDPHSAMPPGTPTWRQGGHTDHFPVSFPRYCVAIRKDGRDFYHFPKAAQLERALENIA